MDDFMKKPRFQIPSLETLRRTEMIRRLQQEANGKDKLLGLIAAEKRFREQFQPDEPAASADKEKSGQQHRAESLELFNSILHNPHTSIRDKLLARERLDILLGLTPD